MIAVRRWLTKSGQGICAGLLIAIGGSAMAQQGYPSKPIRWIVPYVAGGAATVLARLFGEKVTVAWGQQIVVDNRGGGNTIVGSEAMVRAAPDGYTMLVVTSTHVINSLLIPKLPYDSIKDFAPVATLAGYEPVLFLHPSVPANTLQEFIALAKAKPGQLNYASAGSGSATHLAGEYFKMLTGVKAQQIPYKGTAPTAFALVAGEVQWLISPPSTFIPLVKSGKVKAIAAGGPTRLAALPQVPTFTEAGLPAYELKGWYGVLAPATTPRGIVNKLSAEIGRILQTPEMRDKLISQEMEPFINNADQFAALIKSEMVKFGTIIKTANIKMED